MFLHLSVILFTRGSLSRGVSVQRGLCPVGSLSRGSLKRESLKRESLSMGVSVTNCGVSLNVVVQCESDQHEEKLD